MTMSDEVHALTVKFAAIEADLKNVAQAVHKITDGMSALNEVREDLAKLLIHHEQFQVEKQTLWMRLDQHGERLKQLEKETQANIGEINGQIREWRGGINMLLKVIAVFQAAIFAAVGVTWSTLTSTKDATILLTHKVSEIESRSK